MKQTSLFTAAAALMFVAWGGPAFAQQSSQFMALGYLSPGATTPQSLGRGISDDGTVVVGTGVNAGNMSRAFRWQGDVFQEIGGPGNAEGFGISADGSVIVGSTNNGSLEAFRWTQGGGLVGLGFLGAGLGGATYSVANGVSADGQVVVGISSITSPAATRYRAFRWTQGGGMQDLGVLFASPNAFSSANAANRDGSVVVGESTTATGFFEAFRWTQGGGMVGLGYINAVAGAESFARGVSRDGTVVVGQSSSVSGYSEAFRWTQATGMVGLGFLPGASTPASSAYGVSADGTIVVGDSRSATNTFEAFRWTQQTGMQSLGGLLVSTGVDLTGWQLRTARAITPDGQFITGTAFDALGRSQAYIARYIPGIVSGVTTPASITASINDLALARSGLGIHHHGLAAPLLGAQQALGGPSEVGVYGAVGSAAGGVFGRLAGDNGLTFLGGVAYQKEDYPNASLDKAITFAGAVRYIRPAEGRLTAFVEAGGWYAADAGFTFRRSYANGAALATATGAAGGSLSYIYGRVGGIYRPTAADEIALSAEYGHESVYVRGYAEPMSAANPFDATVGTGTDRLDVVKIRLQATHAFSGRWDASGFVAYAHGFNGRSQLVASVPGFGTLAGNVGTIDWVEFGARVGYRINERLTVDGFANGTAGKSIGSRVHVGAALRLRF